MIVKMLRRVLLLAAVACAAGPHQVHVVATDYAFTVADSVPAGLTTFHFENRGTRFHEMFIGLLKPEATPSQVSAAHSKGVGFRQLSEHYLEGDASVALLAGPQHTAAAGATLQLVHGRTYVLLCQLRDSIGKPQHAALGMFHLVRAY